MVEEAVGRCIAVERASKAKTKGERNEYQWAAASIILHSLAQQLQNIRDRYVIWATLRNSRNVGPRNCIVTGGLV